MDVNERIKIFHNNKNKLLFKITNDSYFKNREMYGLTCEDLMQETYISLLQWIKDNKMILFADCDDASLFGAFLTISKRIYLNKKRYWRSRKKLETNEDYEVFEDYVEVVQERNITHPVMSRCHLGLITMKDTKELLGLNNHQFYKLKEKYELSNSDSCE